MHKVMLDGQPATPSKIVCIGRNYVEHIEELNNEVPGEPVIFIKPNSAISSTLLSQRVNPLHYEGEIAFLIQEKRIFAVGLGLDITDRTLQTGLKQKGLPWERAKAFDGSALFSPFVRLDCPLESLRLELLINGETVQQGGHDLMLYKPGYLVGEIGRAFTLEDGDIIMTGTPKGVGMIHQGDRFTGRILSGNRLLVEQEWIAV